MRRVIVFQKLNRQVEKIRRFFARSMVSVNWYIVSKNLFALVLFTIVVFSSYKTIIKWSQKYNELKSETEVLKNLERKKRDRLHQKELLENQEYIRIKAKEANYVDDKAILYDVVEKDEAQDETSDKPKHQYAPPKGVNEWIDLIF